MNAAILNALQTILPVALTLQPAPDTPFIFSQQTFPALALYPLEHLVRYEKLASDPMQFIPGFFNEWFALGHYKESTIIVGPFLFSSLDDRPMTKRFNRSLSSDDLEQLKQALKRLPVLSFEYLTELLALVSFCLTNHSVKRLSHQVKKYSDLIQWEQIQQTLHKVNPPHYKQTQVLYQFEISLVRYLQGKILQLTNDDPFKGEAYAQSLLLQKNYTIFLLELMNRVALVEGVSAEKSYALRTSSLKANANCRNLSEILKVRLLTAKAYRNLIEELSLDRTDRLIERITSYIDHHLTNSLRVKDISQRFYISPSQLRKRFREETGLSVSEYISQEKVKYAKVLLTKRPLLSLKDIAKTLGYFDQSHFARAFRLATGVSPRDYRRAKIAL